MQAYAFGMNVPYAEENKMLSLEEAPLVSLMSGQLVSRQFQSVSSMY